MGQGGSGGVGTLRRWNVLANTTGTSLGGRPKRIQPGEQPGNWAPGSCHLGPTITRSSLRKPRPADFVLRCFFPVSFHSPFLTSLWAFSIFLSCCYLSSLPSLAIRFIFLTSPAIFFFFFWLGPFTGQLNHHSDKGIP